MKRYVREFANDLKANFTPLSHPLTRQSYYAEIDAIVRHCERGSITSQEAVKLLCKLMLL